MPQTHSDIQVVVFRMGTEQYALPTQTAREVISWAEPRPLPGAESWVQGIINLRGEIIPVCDLGTVLGIAGAIAPDRTIICDTSDGSIGLVVDEVTSVTSIQSEDITRPTTMQGRGMQGLIQMDDHLVVLLDLEELLRPIAVEDDESVEDVHDIRRAA